MDHPFLRVFYHEHLLATFRLLVRADDVVPRSVYRPVPSVLPLDDPERDGDEQEIDEPDQESGDVFDHQVHDVPPSV